MQPLMPVDHGLSNMSDIAFRTALVIYILAWALSFTYYVKRHIALSFDQRLKRQRELVAVGSQNAGRTGTTSVLAADPEQDPLPENAEEVLAQKRASASKFGGMTQTVVWLGIIVHVTAAVLRGLAAHRVPLGNLYEYVLVITAFAMIATALVVQRKEWRVLWPWMLTPIIGLLFFGGTKLYAATAPVVPALRSYWLPVHVTTVSVGAAIGIFSGIASILYLLRKWQPKGQEQDGFFGALVRPLPSTQTLDNLAYRSAVVTLPVLGLGILLGAIWANTAWGRPWGWDPKETVSFITWVLYAAYLHARATVSWRGVHAACINVLALAVMIFNLFFINMVVSGLHSYAGLN